LDDSPLKKSQKEKDAITELLMELDFVKRELYEQIEVNKELQSERDTARKQFLDLEQEMEQTLEGYRIVLADTEHSPEDTQLRSEIRNQLKLNEALQKEKNQLCEENMILKDEKKTANAKLAEKDEMIDNLKGQMFEVKKGNSVPKREYDKMKTEKDKCRKDAKKFAEEIRMIEKKLLDMKNEINTLKKEKEQLETEKKTSFSYVKARDEELETLKTKVEKVEKENRAYKTKTMPDTGSESGTERIRDENEALIAQRNALAKKNESLLRDLEKKTKELDKIRKDNEDSVVRLTESNKRFLDEQKELEGKIDELEEKNDRLLEDKNEIIFKQKDEIEALKTKLSEKSSVANKFKDLFTKKNEEEKQKPKMQTISIQTDKIKEPKEEESPSKVGIGMKRYSRQMKNSFMDSSRGSIDTSIPNVKEIQELQRKLKILEKDRMQIIEDKKESDQNYSDLKRMLEKKDDQLEEMRVEIERLAGKLCAAESKLYEVMS
jgi:intraflagellar transport protein 20